MKTLVCCGIALVALAAHGNAQTRPDFSGRWTTAAEPPAPSAPGAAAGQRGAGGRGGARGGGGRGRGPARGDMGTGWGSTITVTQNESALTVEYVYFARGDLQPPMRFVYPLDGSERTNTVMLGWGIQEQQSRTTWRGDTLVITTRHQFPDPETGRATPIDVRHTLVLASTDSLTVTVARAGVLGGQPTTTRTTYRRIRE